MEAVDGVRACGSHECIAGQRDGVICANGECDRVNGVRPDGVLVDYSFRCYSCSKEWEATTTTTDCPACGTTNNHCAANPRGVEGKTK